MRRPLRLQILIPFLLLVAAMIAAVSIVSAALATRRAGLRIESNLRSAGTTLADAQFALNDRILEQAKRLSGADFAVAPAEGKAIYVSGSAFASPPKASAVGPNEIALGETMEIAGDRYFHAVVERRRIGETQRFLHVFYPESQWRAARDEALYPPLIVGAIAALAAVLISIVIAHRLTRPLQVLTGQVARIAEGDFRPLAPPKRNDEVRDLAEGVNRMAEMLERYEEQVRRSERLRTLGQLGGGIAHQLRNAATGCRMAVDLHARSCPTAEDENLTVARGQLERMEEYIKRFLTLGRGGEMTTAAVDICQLAAGVLPLVRPAAAHVGVTLEFMPPADGITIEADAAAIEQALVNLLLNAVEAAGGAPGGEKPARVTIEIARDADGHCLLRVSDTGPGPAAEVAETLFEPLVTSKPDGAGLGLSLARDTARSHGGDLTWRREGSITCFEMRLPFVETR